VFRAEFVKENKSLMRDDDPKSDMTRYIIA